MKEFIKTTKKLKKLTAPEYQAYRRKCEAGPFSHFARFFNDLRGVNFYLNGVLQPKYKIYHLGFTNIEMLLTGKTIWRPRKRPIENLLNTTA